MSESEHNPSSQPAAAGGHNLQPRRGWLPSPLNPLNLLNLLNPGRHYSPRPDRAVAPFSTTRRH